MKLNDITKHLKISGMKDLYMPVISLLVVLVPILVLRPRVLSYNGMNLLLNMAIPIVLVTVAQTFAMTIGEIDFSLGNLVSLVTCVVGTLIPKNPLVGILALLGILGIYMTVGAFLHLRKLPSIVVTIGLSFVWTGLAITIQPQPGGDVPMFLQSLMNLRTPIIPMPIIFMIILAALVHFILFKTKFGILVRGLGGNPKAILQSGQSPLKLQIMVFGLVGLFGILCGMALAGITTSADANMARNYTLLAVASVIIGGGSFAGGKVSPIGVVLGGITMTLVSTLLTFLRISPDWQIGAQGMIIISVLTVNSIIKRKGKVNYV